MNARRLTRPVALGVLLLAIVGGTTGWKLSEKTVTVSVDGVSRQLSTHAGSVRGLVQQAHLRVGPHDVLAPALGTPLADGATVVVRRGRQLTLVVDGVSRAVWVTARSVDEALGQIGLRTDGALLSADRSRAIPLRGFSLDVRTPKAVTVVDAGRVLHVTSTGLQLADALTALHLRLRPSDRIDLPPTTDLRNGLTARITRVAARQAAADVSVHFLTVRRPDAALYRGVVRVLAAGHVGSRHRSFALRFVNGHYVGSRLVSDVVTVRPQTRLVVYGTRARPQPRPVVHRAVVSSSSGGLNWGALAQCESGGNPRAVSGSGTYRGLYQFSFSTWHGVGGSGDPIDASSSEQTYRAQVLYRSSGRGAWPVCGRYL